MDLHNADYNTILPKLIKNNITVDAIITDPPYGTLKDHKIETDINIDNFLKLSKSLLKPNGFLIFFGGQPTFSYWIQKAISNGFNFKQEIIWYKRRRNSMFHKVGKIHENIAVFTKGKGTFKEVKLKYTDIKESLSDFTDTKTILRMLDNAITILSDKKLLEHCLKYSENPYDYYTEEVKRNEAVTMREGGIKICDRRLSAYKMFSEGSSINSVVAFSSGNNKNYGQNSENWKHPTVKPVDLMELLIRLTTNEKEIVLDPFMGSGTTGVACKKLSRDFIGIELYKEYFDMAEKRIKNYVVQEEFL